MEGIVVTFTIAEVHDRHLEALRKSFEADMLAQWYRELGRALTSQAEKELEEPDFTGWLLCPPLLLTYLREHRGLVWETGKWHEAVIDFINELVGDQLEEYGVEIRLIVVTAGFESANRFYILKPGQDPSY